MKRNEGEETNPWKTRTAFTVLPERPGDHGRSSLAKRVCRAQAVGTQDSARPEPRARFYSLKGLAA